MFRIFITISLALLSNVSFAQFNIVKKDTAAITNLSIAKDALIELEKAIQIIYWQPEFAQKQNGFAKKVNASKELAALNKHKNDLITQLKSTAFKNASDQKEMMSANSVVQSYKQFGEHLKTIESKLKPNTFNNMWVLQRSNWLLLLKKL